MCRFIETIKVVNGEIKNLERHLQRITHTAEHFRNICPRTDCEQLIKKASTTTGISKLRFTYDCDGIHDITCTPYNMRRIDKLRLVECDTVEYSFKYEDRSALEILKEGVEDAEEILIVKEGLVTDTTYTNVALHDGKRWITPRKPLLAGTKRAQLIEEGIITECDIKPSDIKNFCHIALFNSMIEMGELVLPVSAITLSE